MSEIKNNDHWADNSIETVMDPSKIAFYINHGYRYLITTTQDFDNLYLFELKPEEGKISIEQKAICFTNGLLHIEEIDSVCDNPSIRKIYPFNDLTSKQTMDAILSVLTGKSIKDPTGLICTLNCKTTLDWVFDCFLVIVKSVRESGGALNTKERNRIINEMVFDQAVNFTNSTEPQNYTPKKRERKTIRPILDFVSDYTVIDIETTGIDPEKNAITEIAAMRIRNHQIDSTFEILVNPGMEIPQEVVEITHITNEMVANQPYIEEVYSVFKDFIGDDIVVGHNIIGFDVEFINSKMPDTPLKNKAIDTMWIARKIMRDKVNNLKLSTICEALGVKNEDCHRALSDVEATYQCYERLNDFARMNNLSIESTRYKNWKASDIKPTCKEAVLSLEGKTFVITGDLGCIERKPAFQRVVDRGGIVKDGLTLKTDFLVLGECDGNTSKHDRAIKMQQDGYPIQIIRTEEFLDMIEYKDE